MEPLEPISTIGPIYEVSKDIIRLILFEYLPPKDVQTCLNTGKLFHVLYPFQVDIVKGLHLGWNYLLSKGSAMTCKYIADKQGINLIKATVEDLKFIIEPHSQLIKSHYQHICNNLNFIIDKYQAFREVCKRGNLTLAKYLYNPEDTNIHAYGDYAFIMACYHNRLEIVKFLYSLDPIGYNILLSNNKIYPSVLIPVFTLGHIEIFNFLYSISTPIHIEYILRASLPFSDIDWVNIDIDRFKWLLSVAKFNKADISREMSICYNLDVLKIFMDSECIIEWWDLFRDPIVHHNFHKLKFLMASNREYFETHLENLLVCACISNDLQIAQFLYQYSKEHKIKVNVCRDKSEAFRAGICGRSLEMIKWMLLEFKDINIHAHDEEVFRNLSSYCNLEPIKYLYEYSVQTSKKKRRAPHDKIIDIHVFNDMPLQNALKHANIEMCRWLLSIGANKNVIKPVLRKTFGITETKQVYIASKNLYDFICEQFPEFIGVLIHRVY